MHAGPKSAFAASQATHMEGLLKQLHRGVHRMWSDTSTRAQVLSLALWYLTG